MWKRVLTFLLVAMMLVLATGCGGSKADANKDPQTAAPKELIKVKIAAALWENLINNINIMIGIDKGWFKEKGLDVEVFSSTGSDAIRAMTTGGMQFAAASPSAGILAYLKGEPITMVAPHTQTTSFAWYVTANSPIKTLEDAKKGKNWGFSGAGSSSVATLGQLLIDAKIEGKQTAVGALGESLAAAKSGAIDLAWGSEPFISKVKLSDNVRVIVNAKDYIKFLLEDALFVRNDFKAEHPDAVKAFVEVHTKAYDWIWESEANKKEAIQIASKYLKLSPEIVESALNFYGKEGLTNKVNPQSFKAMENQMFMLNQTKEPVPWDKVFDQSFLPQNYQAKIPTSKP